MEKYPIPKKDDWATEYADGTWLSGTWASRIKQWQELIKKENAKTVNNNPDTAP